MPLASGKDVDWSGIATPVLAAAWAAAWAAQHGEPVRGRYFGPIHCLLEHGLISGFLTSQ